MARDRYSDFLLQAEKRGIAVSLTRDEYRGIVEAQACHYCGGTQKIGPDRKNPSRGYSTDNVVSCCQQCNKRKLTMAYEPWMKRMRILRRALGEGNVWPTSGLYLKPKARKRRRAAQEEMAGARAVCRLVWSMGKFYDRAQRQKDKEARAKARRKVRVAQCRSCGGKLDGRDATRCLACTPKRIAPADAMAIAKAAIADRIRLRTRGVCPDTALSRRNAKSA